MYHGGCVVYLWYTISILYYSIQHAEIKGSHELDNMGKSSNFISINQVIKKIYFQWFKSSLPSQEITLFMYLFRLTYKLGCRIFLIPIRGKVHIQTYSQISLQQPFLGVVISFGLPSSTKEVQHCSACKNRGGDWAC